ncbi:MAG: hypothetical protein PHC34_05445 [Candidatus Gastranaerophilales bacterium]|nr:hypothetical protein [Candidatus Gastranaerophilales bacterium]
MNSVNFNSSISFEGIKPTIRVGEEVVRSIRKDLPGLKSCTMIVTKMEQHEDNIKYDEVRNKLYNLIKKKLPGISYFRKCGYILNDKLKERVIRLGNADCEVHSDIVKLELTKRGENANLVEFNIIDTESGKRPYNRRSCNDHSFVVLGMKKDASFKDPKTWGTKAVIVDSWAGIVENAFDAIERYKLMIKFDPEIEELVFKKVIN